MHTSPIRGMVRTHGPIILFVVLTIVGSAVIWFGKLLDLELSLITAIPIAMMWLYLAINMLPGLRVHSEQAGDNLYYMGFIFTLSSLGVSLYKFTGQASIEDVVRNFGIAIISTVMGIALRIFFNQMRRDPADIEKAVRHELAEMTRRVRTELDSSAMEFSSYRRTSNQMLSEGFEEIARQAEKNGEAVRAAIEAMSAKAVQSIEETSKRLLTSLDETHKNVAALSDANAKNVAQLSDQMQMMATAVTDKSKQLSEAMDNVIQKYAAARSPDEVLRIDVSPAMESLRLVMDAQAKAISDNSSDTRETAKKILESLVPFKQTASSLNKLVTEVGGATGAQSRSVEVMSGLTSKIEEAITITRASNDLYQANSMALSQLVEATLGRHSEARAAEAESNLRGERLERAISEITNHRPVNEPSLRVDGEGPTVPADGAIIVNTLGSEEDKPRRAWWPR